jgi:AcrR family transcriptional regulator
MGPTDRRNREKKERRNSIIEAAKKLFFAKGLDGTTMDEVADGCELSKGTLYLYFPSKEELALSIILSITGELNTWINEAADSPKNGLDRITDISKAIIRFYKAKREEFHFFRYIDQIVIKLGKDNETFGRWKRGIDDMIRAILQVARTGMEDGSIRKNLNPEKAAYLYSNMVMSFMVRILTNSAVFFMSETYSQDEIIDDMFDMIITSIKA